MHLAAAAGAPTLGLFGPTPAAEYAPAGPRAVVVLSTSDRMQGLSVEAALSGVLGMQLEARGKSPASHPRLDPERIM
jgi:heptosyltransferase III